MREGSATDVVGLLNRQFPCPVCAARSTWLRIARPLRRENSSIHRMCCAQCGDKVVAKVSDGEQFAASARQELREEYATLSALQSAFAQDDHFGTLVPLGLLESGGHAVMLTRFFDGKNLGQRVRSAAAPHLIGRGAGAWLRRLHDCSEPGLPPSDLDVPGKLAFLETAYGDALRSHGVARDAHALLVQCGTQLDALRVPAVRQHGDFKPANMLSDGSRFVGLDIQWRIVGAPVFDFAPFLNHLWLAEGWPVGTRAENLNALVETEFLDGYGYTGELRALRWVQLYFALCYLGRYRQRGRRGTLYAGLKLAPLARARLRQLRECG